MIQYPSVDDVISLNARAVGPTAVVRDRGLVEAAVARPRHGFGDEEFYPNLWDKAGALLHGLASTQGFQDGNKRTAWTTTDAFLRANGWRVRELPPVVAQTFVLAASCSVIDEVLCAEWLRDMSGRWNAKAFRTPGGRIHEELLPEDAPLADMLSAARQGTEVIFSVSRRKFSVENITGQTQGPDAEAEVMAAFRLRLAQVLEQFTPLVQLLHDEIRAEVDASGQSHNKPCWCGSGRKYKHCHA